MLYFAMASGAIAVGRLITSHFSDSPTNTHLQATVPASALFDDLSNTYNWPTGGTFYFADQQYHIQNKSNHNVALALYANHHYANFHLTVSMSEINDAADGAD